MQQPVNKPTGWIAKFANAFRGAGVGMRGQNSFVVHLPAAAVVILAAWWLNVSRVEWCLLVLSIAAVLAGELFNSALEKLGAAITREYDPRVRDALDIASGAVLVTSLGAMVLGVAILGWHAIDQLL